jgi:hypothetical protein
MWATDLESPKAMFAKSPRLPGEIAGKSNHFDFEPGVIAKALKRKYKLHEIPISYYGCDFSEGKKIRYYRQTPPAREARRRLAGGGARAQPPGQGTEDFSRPSRDAGIALRGRSALVLRLSGARNNFAEFDSSIRSLGATGLRRSGL